MADPLRKPDVIPSPEIKPTRPNRPELVPGIERRPEVSQTDQPEIPLRPDKPEVEPDVSPEVLPEIHTETPGD